VERPDEMETGVKRLERRQQAARERIEALLGTVETDPKEAENRPHLYNYNPTQNPKKDTVIAAKTCNYYSRDRTGAHPRAHLAGYAGILQADAFAGYNKLYEAERKPGPLVEAACWVHARRPFFVMADIAANARRKAQGKMAVISPLALEMVRRIDALFEIERSINGQSAEQRRAIRQQLSASLVADLEQWMREQRPKLSRGNDIAKAIDYMLKRWPAFTRFLDDGRICLSNNAAARALRGIALGRKSWLFTGSDRGGQRAAAMYSLLVTAKMNNVDPQAWLADVLARIAEHPARKLDELLPWNWRSRSTPRRQAA
jgi:hypothetical protein